MNRWRAFPVAGRPSRLWKSGQAAEFINEVLSAVPTTFGRLVLIAGLEDATAGSYVSPLLAVLTGQEMLDSLVHSAHSDLVIHWLSLGLDRQVDDLAQYLKEFEARSAEMARTIAAMNDYSDLLPANVREMYRNHFFMEMKRVAVLAKARLE